LLNPNRFAYRMNYGIPEKVQLAAKIGEHHVKSTVSPGPIGLSELQPIKFIEFIPSNPADMC
jgi:hypothetical protein